jgi:ribosomal protein S18 acetylase RimI-like enzyme
MQNITFHKATPADLQTLINSRVEFLSEYWGNQDELAETKLREELKSYFENSLQNESYLCWIAKADNEFAGIGGMVIQQRPGSFRAPDGKSAYIMNMYTVPKYRKMGIASALLEKLIESGKQAGIYFYELHATKEGESVYVKGGFELHKEPTYRKFIKQ